MEQKSRQKRKFTFDKAFPYMLITPTVLIIVVFMAYPIFRVFYLSLQNFDLTNSWKDGFAGISNFKNLFTKDTLFWDSAVTWLICAPDQ